MADAQRRTAAAVATGLLALLLAAPHPQDAVAALGELGTATDPAAPVVAVAALAAWAVAGWLAVTVLLVVLSRVPGQVGRGVGALARRVAPVAVRRAVEATLGLSVAVGVLGPTAALAAPAPGPVAVASPGSGWDLDWPDDLSSPAPTVAPTTVTPTTVTPTRPAGAPPAAPVTARPAAAPVVVRAGDSLWSLAEASLRRSGAAPTARQVAQAWPRWWAANREAVGDDPDLLLPGTVLHPPHAAA